LSKKNKSGFDSDGASLGESSPGVDPADFGTEKNSAIEISSTEVDISPATSTVEVVVETSSVELTPVEISTPDESKGRYSRRDSLRGEVFDEPEPAAMLTADRLIDASAKFRAAPETGWRRLAGVFRQP